MARNKGNQQNIDKSDLSNYPNGRIRDNDGSGNGTPVNEIVYGDLHEYFAKTMREAGIQYNDLPDNNVNGYQYFEALKETPNRNSYAKTASRNGNILVVPVRISNLKTEESFVLKADFDSPKTGTLLSLAQGTDQSSKPLTVAGHWLTGDSIRIINYANSITAVGLYDSHNVPDLVTTLQTIMNQFTNWQKIMAVFIANGAMVFWNKPADDIPSGWQEVTDWRGRFPVGMNINEAEFNGLGVSAGVKEIEIKQSNLPNINLQLRTGTERVGTGNANGMSKNGSDGATKDIPLGGQGVKIKTLPPYRTVLFIEYVGS